MKLDNKLVGKVIMTCLSGSKAYGTSLPTSDTDIRGIFVAVPEATRTPWYTINEVNIPDEEDGKLYELNNFMKLFLDMNPNILELLFVREEEILTSTEEYWVLRREAHALLNRNVAYRFSGYAMSQLRRIKGHDKWINNPQPEAAPTQGEFLTLVHSYLPEPPPSGRAELVETLKEMIFCRPIPLGGDMYAVVEDVDADGVLYDDGRIRDNFAYDNLSDEVKKQAPYLIFKYQAEEHRRAKEIHRNYWEWKANRNETRHELEVKFGYDTKHAMHLVRLMRMAEEILTTGEVNVFREDASELLDIRAGKWSYEYLLQWAEEKDKLVLEELIKTTKLPARSDQKKAAALLMKVQDMAWESMK